MDSICAGIVLYNPDIERLKLNIAAICGQVSKVFLVDNVSSNINTISDLIARFSNVRLIINTENVGIAKALNQLCEAANTDHYEWILTLDQDTICPQNLIMQLSQYINKEDAGIICPAVRYEGWDSVDTEKRLLSGCEEVKACMTSGSLTRIAAWRKVKGFREEYFIDYVDNEFCMKLRNAGYQILRNNSCEMNHQLGDSGKKRILGYEVKYSRHAPWRYYYMIRNNLLFINEYKARLNYPKEIVKLLYIAGKGILFNGNIKKTVKYMKLGLSDARKGKLGKLEIKRE